jgi:hypothetical protein
MKRTVVTTKKLMTACRKAAVRLFFDHQDIDVETFGGMSGGLFLAQVTEDDGKASLIEADGATEHMALKNLLHRLAKALDARADIDHRFANKAIAIWGRS